MPNRAVSHQSFRAVWSGWETKVCNGEMSWGGILTLCWWRSHAGCQLIHTDGRCVRGMIRGPLPSHSGRKWLWTRGGRAGEGVNHCTNAALHHRFLSPPAYPNCHSLAVYTAPPASRLRYSISIKGSQSLRNSSRIKCLWRSHIEHHIKAADPWRWFEWPPMGKALGWPWLLCASHMYVVQSALCAFSCMPFWHWVLWGGLFIFAKAHSWLAERLHTACVACVCILDLALVFLSACFCTGIDQRLPVKVSEFKRAPPLGSCSTDSYKQDLRKCCAGLPCMARRQPSIKNMSPCTRHITHSPASTLAPLPLRP